MKKQIIYSKARGYDLGLARELGIAAALLYSQLDFWNDRSKSEWFYKSYDELVEELPLSKRSIQTAKDILVVNGMIETKIMRVKGTPRLHFRLLQFATFNVANSATSEMANSATSLNTIKNNNKDMSSSQNSQDVRKVYELYLKQFIIPMRLKNRIDNTPQEKLMATAEARYKLTPTRRDAIKRRLKDAGVNMLCAAILGYSREPWYLGENASGWYAKLDEFICRSYDKVEEGANKYAAQKQSKNVNDPWNS